MTAETKPQPGAYTGDWYDERNERRREQYHTDPEYREKMNKLARDGYRDNHGQKKPFDPRVNLSKLESFGTFRVIDGDTKPGELLTFTKGELAVVFARPAKQVQQWAWDGRIPPPAKQGKVEGKERNWIDVYTLAEARAMVEALGPFLADLIYFRRDNVDAIKAVHDAIEKVR